MEIRTSRANLSPVKFAVNQARRHCRSAVTEGSQTARNSTVREVTRVFYLCKPCFFNGSLSVSAYVLSLLQYLEFFERQGAAKCLVFFFFFNRKDALESFVLEFTFFTMTLPASFIYE